MKFLSKNLREYLRNNLSSFYNSTEIKLDLIIRLVLSIIFLFSAAGKLLYPAATELLLEQLTGLPPYASRILVLSVILFEITLSFLIWFRLFLPYIIPVPFIFLIVLFYSQNHKINCGCFGSLPLLNSFPFWSHILLLVGMPLTLYYLNTLVKSNRKSKSITVPQISNKVNRWSVKSGKVGLIMIIVAFASLPFSSPQKNSKNVTNHIRTVDRIYVEKAIKSRSAILIDARLKFQFDMGHIPSAINIPYNNTKLLEFSDKQKLKAKLLIVYCSDPECQAAEILARKLVNIGYKNIALYAGGWKDWSKR